MSRVKGCEEQTLKRTSLLKARAAKREVRQRVDWLRAIWKIEAHYCSLVLENQETTRRVEMATLPGNAINLPTTVRMAIAEIVAESAQLPTGLSLWSWVCRLIGAWVPWLTIEMCQQVCDVEL